MAACSFLILYLLDSMPFLPRFRPVAGFVPGWQKILYAVECPAAKNRMHVVGLEPLW
ncbi:hypothetical protein hamaS1_30300 [Moorella sp. Hama-1]|nr:hypothetical protein hamaS1_30300 [Moorella sp. Hama-1]